MAELNYEEIAKAFIAALKKAQEGEETEAERLAKEAKRDLALRASDFVVDVFAKSEAELKKPNPDSRITHDLRDIRLIFLQGYIGHAYTYNNDETISALPKPGCWRVYLSPELNSYIEFEATDLRHHTKFRTKNGLEGFNIWLRAKRPRKDDKRTGTAEEICIKEEEMEDIELTFGGNGYELSRTKHYIDGDMLAGMNGGGDFFGGIAPPGPNTKLNTLTCGPNTKGNTLGCGPNTKGNTLGCGPNTKGNTLGCEGGRNALPTGMICDKYVTVIGCDEWDFRKTYSPY